MVRRRWQRFCHDVRGVSPIVGTLLVLAITVLGMTGVMFWGAPTIENLRVTNTQAGVLGEFEDIRQKARELSVPDAARLPTINVPGGVLGLEEGSRFLISAMYNGLAERPDVDPCAFDVSGWADGDGTVFTVALPEGAGRCFASGQIKECTAGGWVVCLAVYEVRGGSLVEQTVTYDHAAREATLTGADLADRTRNWVVRIQNGTGPDAAFLAEAWLLSSDRLFWRQDTSSGLFEAYYDSGAIFSGRNGAIFQEERPIIQEKIYDTDVFSMWLYTIEAISMGEITASGTYQVFLGLQALHSRIDSDNAVEVRFGFEGHLAEAWCQGLIIRNSFISSEDPYSADTIVAGGTGNEPCTIGDADGIRRAVYDPAATTFPIQFVHARLRANVQV